MVPSTRMVRGTRRFRLPLWAAASLTSALLLAFGAAWAVSSPPGSSPDDDYHLASIWCAWGERAGVCEQEEAGSAGVGSAQVPVDVVRAPCFAYDATASGACGYSLPSSDLVGARVNDGSYPGLFYLTMRLFVHGSVDEAVVAMRITNVVLAAVLLGAAIILAPAGARRALGLAWLVTLTPLSVSIIASTNPSSWTLIGLGTYWLFLYRTLLPLGGRKRWAAAVLAAVSAALTAGSRADGAAYLVVTTLAVAVVALPTPRDWVSRRMVLPALVILAATAVFLSSGQSDAVMGVEGAQPIRSGWSLLAQNVLNFPSLLTGMLGLGWGLGWLDTPIPTGAGALTWGAAVTVLVLSATEYWKQKLAAVVLLVCTMVALPLFVLQTGGSVVGENVQPRYILPLFVAVMGVALLSHHTGSQPWWSLRRPQSALLVSGVALANSLALHAYLRRYVTGVDGPAVDLDAAREWWWSTSLTPMTIWVLGSIFGALLFGVLGFAGEHRSDQPRMVTGAPGRKLAIASADQPQRDEEALAMDAAKEAGAR